MKSGAIVLGTLALGLLTTLTVVANDGKAAPQETGDGPTVLVLGDQIVKRDSTDPGQADEVAADIAAALASRQLGAQPNTAANPVARMTSAERSAFRLAAQGCWSFDPGSPVRETVVTVGFDLDQDGKVAGPVQLVSYHGPAQDGTKKQAFAAAQRVILQCQSHAVPLPPEEHDNVRRAEMTFNARTWTIL